MLVDEFRSSQLIRLLLLMSGSVHPNPGPVSQVPHRVLQLNVNGIQSSTKELAEFLSVNKISVATIQESKLRKK